MDRCNKGIMFGTVATRCDKKPHGDSQHEGPGLSEFPGQRIEWFDSDRRQFITYNDSDAAWEVPAT